MSKSHLKIFKRIGRKWQLIRGTETILLAAIFTIPVVFAGSMVNLQILEKYLLAVSFFLILMIALFFKKRIINLPSDEVSRYLNQHFPQLENSAGIMLIDENELSVVQRIQKQKIETKFAEVSPQIKIPNKILLHLGLLALAVLLLFYFPSQHGDEETTKDENEIRKLQASATNIKEQGLPPEIKSISVTIYPPAYMQQAPIHSDHMSLTFPEASRVVWNIVFSDSIRKASLFFDNGDSATFQQKKDSYQTQKKLKKDGFYFLRWYGEKDTLQSDYYAIRVQPDQAPNVEIRKPVQYLEMPYTNDKNSIAISVVASDDYGISSAHIVATVSRGSGEAVKFREQRLNFKKKLRGKPKKAILEANINLDSLGIAPGDELYYYVVVADNRVPKANASRTDTYFVNIPDTARNEVTIGAGLGVDQMPEYFRSQRQIIIDTEKIIEETPKLTKTEYQDRLNQLGIDQKLLRLRYGQFLGEEFESGITAEMETLVQEANSTDDHHHADGEAHDHQHEESKPGQDDGALLESYMHIHDYQGEATFFDDAIKAQLKAALAQMWESELRLRTYRPKEALPFEYKALELIKDIQQKSRVYVERIGFEPPILKPVENRLTGDLDEINSVNLQKQLKEEVLYPAIRTALEMVEVTLGTYQNNTFYDKTIIERAGQEMAGLAVEEPGRYLHALASFRILADENLSDNEAVLHLTIIREAMQKALPIPETSPFRKDKSQNDLFRLFQLELSNRQGL